MSTATETAASLIARSHVARGAIGAEYSVELYAALRAAGGVDSPNSDDARIVVTGRSRRAGTPSLDTTLHSWTVELFFRRSV